MSIHSKGALIRRVALVAVAAIGSSGTLLVPAFLAVPTVARATSTQVFTTGFESGLPAEFSAPGSVIQGVQGYAGLGPAGRQFSGSFLRYTAVTLFPTTLTLRGLPPHDSLDVKFLLAVIDSWDGTELMQVRVDGVLRFSHWFQLATGDASSYVAAPGALLSSGTNLGFSAGGYWSRDRAYDLGVEPAFLGIPHTADSVVVVWSLSAVSGPAASQWQGGDDESWAIDEVSVLVSSPTVDVAPGWPPGSLALAAPWPTPGRGGSLMVRFALPSDAPATLALLDVAGRVVSSSQVGSLGAGEHSVDLAAGHRLAPGLYFVRLSQRDQARVARAVIVN